MHTDTNKYTKETQKITFVTAIVNLFLAIIKIVFGVIGNSQSLVADGIHSFSDLLTDFLVWVSLKHSSKEPDDEHPYGHKRFETAATFGLGIVLGLTGIAIIYDAVLSILNPKDIITPDKIVLVIAFISIMAKEFSYWWTIAIAKRLNSNILRANAWHHRTDAISSVVVLIGVLGSILGYIYLDAIAAILVGIMILYVSWKIGINSLKELVDTGIETEKIEELKQKISNIKGVHSLHMLRTRKHANQIMIDMHIQVNPFLTVSEGHIISVIVENMAKKTIKNVHSVTVHIDPEDDELKRPYKDLPDRHKALKIIDKALKDNNFCKNNLNKKISLHYLEGKIHIDFYLPIECIEDKNSHIKLLHELNAIFKPIDYFTNIKVYYGSNLD